MKADLPLTRDLVLIGGGHAHALVLRRWGMDPLPGARLTLIDPGPTTAYSGMLPGFVAGHYALSDLEIDLVRLARFAGARLILGPAQGIDLVARTIDVPGRPPIGFDVASIDIGITSAMPDLPGFAAHGHPAKPLGPFATAWAGVADRADLRLAVIGGGVAGAELAMAMAWRTRGTGAEVRLIERGRALSDLPEAAAHKLRTALRECGVEVIEEAGVAEVTATSVRLSDGREIASDFTTGAAGARPHGWLGATGLTLEDGFVAVDRTLRSSDPAIFAVGDCAHMSADPRPKAGVYAVRQAPVLAWNLRSALSDGPLRRYRPQGDYLKLVSLGRKAAMAAKWNRAFAAPPVWRWKDSIDRSFMCRLTDLPSMEAPLPVVHAAGMDEAQGGKPMCGGCGAKVGRGALRAALTGLPGRRDDVGGVPGDDSAVLTIGGARQVVTTDHLRAVVDDPALMTRIAAIHALGDVWAMGARPQAAFATLILPRMSPVLQRRTLSEIMSVAADVMGDAGAIIAGGHTSMGSDLTIGFTVTGLLDREPITLAGARDGDVLILTKPIGSGTILAAEMAGQAAPREVAACWEAMVRPQGQAAEILCDAHAMTDVTGFGLAGHLAGICEASATGAELRLAEVPFLAGAERLAGCGIRSTIWAENRDGAGPVFGATGPRGDLLFDPQTAGGLLAAVAEETAEAVLTALRDADIPAVRIGRITAGPPAIRVV